jgi:4'-phosphopantetheinyl transferase
MPLLLLTHPFPDATFGLWQIAEGEDFFRVGLPLVADEEAELGPLRGLRRMEWLAGRWLLHRLTGRLERLPLAKDVFSKPFFLEKPDLFCSLSHSHGVVGALLAEVNCGCDIQLEVEKMARLAPKFLSAEETAFSAAGPESRRLDLQHIFWTAKESLYKAYGLKELDFRGHLFLDPFEWDGRRGESSGRVEKGAVRQDYRLIFEKLPLPDAGSLFWTVCLPATSGPAAAAAP